MEKLMDKEFDVLRVVKDHPNVAKVYALQKRKAYGGWEARVLMEYCPVGLFDYLKLLEKEKRFIAEEDIWGMMYDLVSAVGFMHKQNPPMVHRDLKLENVMQGKDGRWKLIDFGSVVYGTVHLKTKDDCDREEEQIAKYTTQMSRAPEMVDFFGVSAITEKTDIWALGCILYTLMFMKQPFANAGKLAILGAKYTIPPRHRYSPELVNLLKMCLTADPVKRASAVELVKVIKPKVGKRGPRPVQKVNSTFRDDYAPSDEEEEEELGQPVVGTVAAHAEGRAAETGEEGSAEGHEADAETSVSERRPARGRGLGGDVELVVSEESGVAGGRGEEERGVVQREREHAVEDGGGADGDERKGFPDGGEGGDGREHLQGKANSAQPLEEAGHLGPRW